jgi:NADPH:quinone reductase-like Zn-dependent oxidoreductase
MIRACFLATAIASLLPLACPADESTTMQAVRYYETGPSSVLKVETAPRPVAGPGEVLVHVSAAGVNPIDVQLRQRWPGKNPRSYPAIPGHDISGRVVSAGTGVDPSLVSKDIFALLSWNGGAYAEYVAVPAEAVVLKPARLTHVQAAAVPLVALTAYQALFVDGHLAAGQTVLIHGGSGGVGHMAVQLAKNAGARVIATASAENLEFVRSLGADVVIDYRAKKFEDVARDVDFVLDAVGGETLKRSYGVVRSGGTLISIVESPDAASLAARKIEGKRIFVRPDKNHLQQIAALIDKGAVKPTVSMTYPLSEAAVAQDDLSRLRKPGKSVLIVRALDAK